MKLLPLSTLIVILLFVLSVSSAETPKIVWVYVQEVGSLNQLQRLCLSNIRTYSTQSKYEYRLITNSNYSQYLANPQELQKILANSPVDSSILKKTYIQLSVLQTHGGIWINIPIILTQSFDWIQTIKNQRHINNRIDQPQAILFYTPEWFQQTFKRTSVKIENLVIYPKYHSWFVAAVPKSQLITDWKRIFVDIVTRDKKSIDQLFQSYDLTSKDFLIKQQFLPEWALQTAVKIKQIKLDNQYGTASFRRLAVTQYKISAIDAQQTAYIVSQQAKYHTHLTTKYFTQLPLKEIQMKFAYLLRIQQEVAEQITSIIDQQIPLSEHLHSSVSLVCQNGKIPYRHIIEGSVVDEYLIKGQNSPVKRYSSEFIKHHCSVTYESVFYDFLLYYVAPLGAFVGQVYIVRRMLLIFKPEWGVRRRKM